MNEAIELHDSVLDSVEVHGGNLILSLRPAYVHRSTGLPGVDDGVGFVQDFAIEFSAHKVEGDVGILPSNIFDGDFELDGVLSPNMINLPCAALKPATLVLHLAPDYRRVSISGDAIRVRSISEATYVEEFKGGKA